MPAQKIKQVVGDIDSGGVIDRAVIVQEDNFNPRTVIQLCQRFLASKKNYILLRYTIGTELRDVAESLYGPRIRGGLHEWIAKRLQRDPQAPTVARLLATTEGAVLYYHDRSAVQEINLGSGRDPTVIKVGDARYHLLHFSTEGPEGTVAVINLFFQTPFISLASSKTLSSMLKNVFYQQNINVYVRTNPWFIYNSNFPPIYPFQMKPRLPLKSELDAGAWVTCSYFQDLSCGGKRFAP